jgi:hypothetical protein
MEFNDYRSWKAQALQQSLQVLEHLTDKNGNPGNLSVAKDKNGNRVGEFLIGDGRPQTRGGFLNPSAYSNGRQKAEIRHIAGGCAVYVDGRGCTTVCLRLIARIT